MADSPCCHFRLSKLSDVQRIDRPQDFGEVSTSRGRVENGQAVPFVRTSTLSTSNMSSRVQLTSGLSRKGLVQALRFCQYGRVPKGPQYCQTWRRFASVSNHLQSSLNVHPTKGKEGRVNQRPVQTCAPRLDVYF